MDDEEEECSSVPSVQNRPCRGPLPNVTFTGGQEVRSPVESMLYILSKSAPRSGLTMNEPVGSRKTECGCGESCWETAPGCVMLKWNSWFA